MFFLNFWNLNRRGTDVTETRMKDLASKFHLDKNDPIYKEYKKENPDFSSNNEVFYVKGKKLSII